MKPAIIKPDLELKKEIRELPQRNAIYIRLFGDYKLNDYAGTWIRLIQFVKEQKLPMGDPSPLCIYHDDPKVTPAGKLRMYVCCYQQAQLQKEMSDSNNYLRDVMQPSSTKGHTISYKLYMIQFTANIYPKWSVP